MCNGSAGIDMHLHTNKEIPVIVVPERLTVIEAVDFKEKGIEILSDASVPSSVVLDFSSTEFIDSSGIGALVNLFKISQDNGVVLSFVRVGATVKSVLSLTHLDQLFNIIDDPKSSESESTFSVPQTHPSVNSRIKRFLDIIGSLLGLCITGIVFIPIAILIKVDSQGPIFFKQERCGWLGKRFKIIKFRSMCVNAESLKNTIVNEVSGPFFKNKNDSRITRVGKFLRRTSLDELPQFWNVLKGDMSLVGTRPPTPDEVEKYGVPEWQRLNVKPGMTGQWQVFGRSKVLSFEDVIKYDLDYQEKWSLGYDIELIIRTILIIFRKNNGAV